MLLFIACFCFCSCCTSFLSLLFYLRVSLVGHIVVYPLGRTCVFVWFTMFIFLLSAIRSNSILNLFGVSLVQGVVFLIVNIYEYVGLSCSGMCNIGPVSKISLFLWYLIWVYNGLLFQEKKLM